jgi:predicted lipoprotein
MWRALVALCGIVLWGCGEEAVPYDRNAMLTSVAERLALPAHEVLATRAQTLEAAAEAACADGAMSEAELGEVRAAWWGARQAMELLAAFSVGPWRTAGLGAMLDRWPTNDVEIERLVGGDAALDDSLLATLGANKRGLPALEYLLWGAQVSGRRCALTALLAKDVSASADALLAGWSGEGGFARQLGQAGRVEGMYANAQEALGDLANVAVAALEMIVGTQLGKPLGLTTGGAGRPELAECFRSRRSLEVVRLNLESAWRLYAGAEGGVGLGDMVRARSSGADGRMRAAFEAAFVALDALGGSPGGLEQAVVSDRASVEAAREAIRAVLRLWKTEVIGALGVTLTFNDNDGD